MAAKLATFPDSDFSTFGRGARLPVLDHRARGPRGSFPFFVDSQRTPMDKRGTAQLLGRPSDCAVPPSMRGGHGPAGVVSTQPANPARASPAKLQDPQKVPFTSARRLVQAKRVRRSSAGHLVRQSSLVGWTKAVVPKKPPRTCAHRLLDVCGGRAWRALVRARLCAGCVPGVTCSSAGAEGLSRLRTRSRRGLPRRSDIWRSPRGPLLESAPRASIILRGGPGVCGYRAM